MATEYINPQWRLPNEKTGNNQGYSMVSYAASRRVEVSGLANDLSITDQLTVSGWMKPSIGQINKYAFGFIGAGGNNGFDFGFHGGTCGSYANFSSSAYAYTNVTFSYADGNWHHFVVSYNGSKHKIYIDGIFKAESSRTGNISFNSNGNFYMFNTATSNSSGATGELTDVCVFDNALSDGGVSVGSTATGQIAGLYASTNPMALSSPPQAYYPLGNSAHMGSNYLTPNGALQDYVFDFSSSTISIGDLNAVEGNDFTISIWLNRDSAHSSVIYNSGSAHPNGLIFQSNQNGSFFISVGGGSGTTSIMTISDGVWYNAILTVSGTTAKVYVNGSQLGSSLTVGSARTGIGSGTVIGEYNHGSGFNFNGKLSNVQIFSTELLATEATTLYNYGSPIQTLANIPQSSNLKAWYKLDATEIYNSTNTEWSVDNNQNPSAYPSSLNFNRATSDSISLGSSSSIRPTGDYTISIWYNLNSTVNAGIWCAGTNINNSGLTLFSSSQYAGGLALYHKGGSGTSAQVNLGSDSIVINSWHNAIFTYDDTSRVIKGYLNGDLISTVSVAGTGSVSWANNFYLGRLIQNGSYYLDGRLSNFQIFNTKLEETGSNSVETLYNSGTPLTDMSSFSSLVSWWKLNNTITGIEDSKGSNNGTNNGTTEYAGFVNTLAGDSTGMSQSSLVQSDLLTTSSYSPYALSFGGNGNYIDLNSDITLTGNKSVSFWVNFTSTIYAVVFGGDSNNYYPFIDSTNINIRAGGDISSFAHGGLTAGIWYNVCIAGDGTNATAYLNGSSLGTQTDRGFTFKLINAEGAGFYGVNGKLSNCAIWNTALTSSQVREIYNEGLPSNLHKFSGTAPVAWWQLGSNSSWTSPAWTVLDEIGSNNGTSISILENAIVDGVGTSGNGVSANMGSANNISGSSPSGEANSLSVNMTLANIAGGVN